MRFRIYLLAGIIGLPLITYCQNQNTAFQNRFFPKIKEKLYALSPNATNVHYRRSLTNDTTEEVDIKCNCLESSNPMRILFDSNGTLLDMDVYFRSLSNLPDKINDSIKANAIEGYKLNDSILVKSTNNYGEIAYSVYMSPAKPVEGPTIGTYYYILKFKSSGEFISKEKKFMPI